MKKTAAYLVGLIGKAYQEGWRGDLREILLSEDFQEKSDNPQSCIVSFALNQAKRRLDKAQSMGKKTFGIEELISELSVMDGGMSLEFYSIENSQYLGACYVADGHILGCECILKTGTVSKPGLWVDGKKID